MCKESPDIVCVQEIKAQEHQLDDAVFHPAGYHRCLFQAEKKGYSGVAIYSRAEPDAIHTGLGFELADVEGRYIQTDFENLSVASIYLPSGSSSEFRQEQKYHFMEQFDATLEQFRNSGRHYILCGDWNIAHKQIDLKNWRGNQKNSGFLPEERAWMDDLFDARGWVDAFREVNPDPDQYTWWSNRGQAWSKNVGWRIDYQVISPGLRTQVRAADIYKQERFSDHAPLTIEYDYPAPG